MFSKWKGYIRSLRPRNESELFNLIDNINNVITSDDCNGFFRHMFVFIHMSISRVEIIDE